MPKIITEIIQPNGEITRRKLPFEGNKIIIKSPKKKGIGRPAKDELGEYAEFSKDCIVIEKKFLFKRPKVMLMAGADRCITFFRGDVEVPQYDKATIRRFADDAIKKIVSSMGGKVQFPTSILILMCLMIFLMILNLLVSSGRLRF